VEIVREKGFCKWFDSPRRQARQRLQLVLRQAAILVGTGIAIGLVAALAVQLPNGRNLLRPHHLRDGSHPPHRLRLHSLLHPSPPSHARRPHGSSPLRIATGEFTSS
jgi:hypothetical protein